MEDVCTHTCVCGRYVEAGVIVEACDCQEVGRACGSRLPGQMLGEAVPASMSGALAVGV